MFTFVNDISVSEEKPGQWEVSYCGYFMGTSYEEYDDVIIAPALLFPTKSEAVAHIVKAVRAARLARKVA